MEIATKTQARISVTLDGESGAFWIEQGEMIIKINKSEAKELFGELANCLELFGCFDDTEAAEKYRLMQAQKLIDEYKAGNKQ